MFNREQTNYWQERLAKALYFFLILVAIMILASLVLWLKELVIIFTIATLINYLLDKPVALVEKFSKNRAIAVLINYLIIISVLVLAITKLSPIITEQLSSLRESLPTIQHKIAQLLEQLSQANHFKLSLPQEFDNLNNAHNLVSKTASLVKLSLYGSVYAITSIVIISIASFYMLLDGQKIWSLFLGLFPRKYETHLNEIKHRIDSNLSALITGQFKIASLTAAAMLLTYIAIGNKYAIILGCFQMLEFIPILGTWTAIIPSLIIVAATSSINKAGIALVVYLVYGQIIRDHILAPRIMGNAFGVHPLAVIFGLLISVQIFGIIGIVVGLPIIAVISAIVDYLIKLRELHNFND